jgi:hypothetical protein
LAVVVRRDHHEALLERGGLLEPLASFLDDATRRVAADGFPAVDGRLPDRRSVSAELLPDTLVTRRLPQLWLVVTIREHIARPGPSVGALARPTGAEFYSCIGGLEHRVTSQALLDAPTMIRADRQLDATASATICEAVGAIFRDRRVKEIMVTGQVARIVSQAAEGDRGAHLILRQSRFASSSIDCDVLVRAIADADALRRAVDAIGIEKMALTA